MDQPTDPHSLQHSASSINHTNTDTTLTNGNHASEQLSHAEMTGLAVPSEPITEAAKAVIVPEMQTQPGDTTLDHTAAVDAPTSGLRDSPSPAKNPAEEESKAVDSMVVPTPPQSKAPSPIPQSEVKVESVPIESVADQQSEVKESTSTEPAAEQPEGKADLMPIDSAPEQQSTENNIDTMPTDPAQQSTENKVDSMQTDTAPETAPLKHERSDESAEPQAKRARTDTGSASPMVTFAEPDPQRKMTANRQKYCLVVIRALKRGKDAAPFLVPVDPVKLKIPNYPEIITNPQDLGTIETKLKKNEYETIDDFIDSVQLVWANCERYNGAESAINKMALRLKEQFERQIRSMPAPEADTSPASKKGKKKGPVKKSQSPASGLPTIRRESIGYDGRPKREIHAPPPKSLPYQNAAPRRGKNAAQLKFCNTVLKELMKKTHESYAYVFYAPVDAEALGLADYHTIIRNPMDLGTIQTKLNAGEYESADDVEYDIRLMFRNCYKYNQAGSPVHAMGKRLENVFNEKWAEKPVPRPEGYGSDSDEDSDENGKNLQMLTKQLEAMKNQIAGLSSQGPKKKKKKKYEDDGAGPRDASSMKIKKFGRKSMDDVDESPMIPSFDQKTALSTKMGYMTEHQMPVVIQILKRTDPNFDPEDEEVELDVDKVHPKTIRLLWNWIMDDILPSFLRKKGPKPKKNRSVLSENEQQRQIEQLEQQLSRFSGDAGYGYDRQGDIPNDDSSDSDSSEDDD